MKAKDGLGRGKTQKRPAARPSRSSAGSGAGHPKGWASQLAHQLAHQFARLRRPVPQPSQVRWQDPSAQGALRSASGVQEKASSRRTAGRARAQAHDLWALLRIPLLAAAIVVFTAGVSLGLWWGLQAVGFVPGGGASRDQAQAIPVPPPVPVPASRDPLDRLPKSLVSGLLAPQESDGVAGFIRIRQVAPEELCALLGTLGLPMSEWGPAPFQSGVWQCASEVMPLVTESVDFDRTTLFAIVRGSAPERVDGLRLKLVAPDPSLSAHGLEGVELVLAAVAERYQLDWPDGFRPALAGFAAFEGTRDGLRVQLHPEDPELAGDATAARRLNILLHFPPSPLWTRGDRYAPLR